MKPYYVVQSIIRYTKDGYSQYYDAPPSWEDVKRFPTCAPNKFKTIVNALEAIKFLQGEYRIIKRTDEVVRTKKWKRG